MSAATCIDTKREKAEEDNTTTSSEYLHFFNKLMSAFVDKKPAARPAAPLRFSSVPAFQHNASTDEVPIGQRAHSTSATPPESPGFFTPMRWCAALGKPSSPGLGESIELEWINKDQFPGHRFQSCDPDGIAYCDYCARHIWGLGPNACYVCKYCKTTCHLQCCDQVQVKCIYRVSEQENEFNSEESHHLYMDDSHYSLDDSNSSNNNTGMLNVDLSGEQALLSSSPRQSNEAVVMRPRISRAASSASTSSNQSTYSTFSTCSTASSHRRYSLLRGGVLVDSDDADSSSTASEGEFFGGSRSRSSSIRLSNYDFTSLDKQSIHEFDISVNEQEPLTPVMKVTADYKNEVTTIDWRTINVDQLNDLVSVFNKNNQGLYLQVNRDQSSLPASCHGTLRVHINLIRPIKMSLTDRPPSIFDIIDSSDAPGDDYDEEPKPLPEVISMRAFRLPRGSTKLLHVNSSTTAQKVISALLHKFHINDSPHKFALYEHTIRGDTEVSVRKIHDTECPLRFLIQWSTHGVEEFNERLDVKRIVLQENETGDIQWDAFSLPELNSFLFILDREEEEYRSQILLKFNIRRREIKRLLEEFSSSRALSQSVPDQ